MDVHGPTRQPNLHRPLTPGDFAIPPPVVAEESAEQAAALVGIKASDRLAELAEMDPKALAEVERQEWHEHR